MRQNNSNNNCKPAENMGGQKVYDMKIDRKIERRKKTVIAVFLLAAVAANALVFNAQSNQAQAATSITVRLDGKTLSFTDVLPQIIKDRTMVPFRAIGEAMGATVEWHGDTQEVTMTLLDKYVKLYIGSPFMLHGIFSVAGGVMVPDTTSTYELESPAVIVNDRTLVPVRAISEGLGGTVEWDPKTQTVSLTSPYGSLMATPTPAPNPVFSDNAWFSHISAAEAQSKYNNNEQFILFMYYPSTSTAAKNRVEAVKTAAKEAGIKVHAINVVDNNFRQEDIPFVWDKVVNKDRPEYPFLIYVNGSKRITYTRDFDNSKNLDFDFNKFVATMETGVMPIPPTPSPSPEATPITSPSATPNPNDRLIHITREMANTMLESDQKFVYAYYNSSESGSAARMEIIKNAAVTAGVNVYATDIYLYDYRATDQWWGNPRGESMSFPTVFYIQDRIIIDKDANPNDASKLALDMIGF